MTHSSTIVGALACQNNSFLKTLKTTVVSSIEYDSKIFGADKNGKSKQKNVVNGKQYAIELKDTILFPEGGGQPYDTGYFVLPNADVIKVQSVLRDKLTALHITEDHIEPGTEITINLDWDRRIDLMQQHTGQHLLSAVFDTYDLETLSWSMGEVINYIELPRKVSDDILDEVDKKVNELITESIPISVTHPDEHGEEIDVSHIPEDYDTSKGIIRIVKIGLLDANPCCGTHLSSTGQVQSIALLHQTSVRGGNSRLFFTCGSRVSKYLRKQNELLKSSGSQLSCQIEEVSDKIAQLNTSYKKASSRESNLLKELANIEARRVFQSFDRKERSIDFVYKADNNPEYILYFQKELITIINNSTETNVNINDKQTIIMLNGDYRSGLGGMIKILGPKSEEVSNKLKEILTNLKGGGKKGNFQGKVSKYEKGELESVIRYLESLQD